MLNSWKTRYNPAGVRCAKLKMHGLQFSQQLSTFLLKGDVGISMFYLLYFSLHCLSRVHSNKVVNGECGSHYWIHKYWLLLWWCNIDISSAGEVWYFNSPTQRSFCMCRANERWRYNATSSLIGWAHTQNDPCSCWYNNKTVLLRDTVHQISWGESAAAGLTAGQPRPLTPQRRSDGLYHITTQFYFYPMMSKLQNSINTYPWFWRRVHQKF